MDKVIFYRQAIKNVLTRYKDLLERCLSDEQKSELESVFVFDDANGNYGWLKFGWPMGKRFDGITAFVRLREGKFYIEEDCTEEGIANELVTAGVSKEDIVLAFQPPSKRIYTEFAVA